MIARITNIAPTGSWNSQHGLMYSFDVEFDDGMTGQANSKSPNPPYQIGDDMDYQQTGVTPKGQNKLKIQKPDHTNQPQPAAARPAPANPNPFQRAAARPQPAAPRPIPANPVPQGSPVNGQTVGMALNNALTLHSKVFDGDGPSLGHALADIGFWVKVETTASRIIAISRGLEQGKRPAPHPEPDPDVPY